MKYIMSVIVFIVMAIGLSGCGIQSIPRSLNTVEASQAEIMNQYKRRADLIPNLVKTVKAYASHEKDTLVGVVNARAKATSTKIDAGNMSSIKQFQAAQSGLSSALSRLMVVVEKYPDLKADRNFRELQAQLEGTENRITIARQRHIKNIKGFNDLVTVIPTSWANSLFFHHTKMPQWTADNAEAIKKAPEVDF
ncbi:MAG: LemA family protein [Bdellovibrionaceae bacterium]|nr:LemA family protein [Pseudobdellovibrionaceae bacterium]